MTSSSTAPRNDERGTWFQAIASLLGSIFLILFLRWVAFEPYVIPSGSMWPTLRELDFILVNKFAYGVRWPLSSNWLYHREKGPDRCDVVVFRSPQNEDTFMIKRVIGLPGESVEVLRSGRVRIDGVPLPWRPVEPSENQKLGVELNADEELRWREGCRPDEESSLDEPKSWHWVQTGPLEEGEVEDPVEWSIEVPQGHLVLLGDNRHRSADSRAWGSLPSYEVLGRASLIWLSCDESWPDMPRLCRPNRLRWSRMGQFLR